MTEAKLSCITTDAAALTVTDEPLIGFYEQWQAAYADLNAKLHAFSEAEGKEMYSTGDADLDREIEAAAAEAERQKDEADEIEDALAKKIRVTPAKTVVGALVKMQLAEFCLRENHLTDLPASLAINAMRDARRFL